MFGICMLTVRRLREPASIILLLIGCLFSFFVSGTEAFEISNIHGSSANELIASNKILLGTVLLVGLGILISIFNGATEIPRDISSRVIFILLSKPISRLEYVGGKFLGVLVIGLGSTIVWITLMLVFRVALSSGAAAHLSGSQILAQYTCALMLVPITALAICSSCCFGDVVSMIVTVVYLLLSFAMVIAPIVAALSPAAAGKIVLAVYFFFPNLCLFLQSYPTFWASVAIVVYAFCSSTLFLLLGKTVFEHGDVD